VSGFSVEVMQGKLVDFSQETPKSDRRSSRA
jgi:hypothetical protein